MEYVLTTDSSISCDHPSLGGGAMTTRAPISSQNVLKVDGQAVLVQGLSGSIINSSGCSIPVSPSSSNKKCTSISAQDSGLSQVFKVNGAPVLLKNSRGSTDGVLLPSPSPPPQTWSAKDANQTVLRAD